MLTLDYLGKEASQDHRSDFEKYLQAAPDVQIEQINLYYQKY